MNLKMERRVIKEVKINPINIQSGDLFLIRRFDGVQPFFMTMSGSNAGHAAVALRDVNDTLWIVESQYGSYFDNKINGVQKNKYEDWIRMARDADYEVVWLPMKDELRQKLNL